MIAIQFATTIDLFGPKYKKKLYKEKLPFSECFLHSFIFCHVYIFDLISSIFPVFFFMDQTHAKNPPITTWFPLTFLFCLSEFTTHTHQNVTPVPVVYRGWYLSGCSFIHNATFVTPFVGLAHGSSIKWSTPVSQTAASGFAHRWPMSPTMWHSKLVAVTFFLTFTLRCFYTNFFIVFPGWLRFTSKLVATT